MLCFDYFQKKFYHINFSTYKTLYGSNKNKLPEPSSSKCSSTFSSEIKSHDIKLTVIPTNCRTNGTTL